MVHSNPATIHNGIFKVDRKFHLGMQTYAAAIPAGLTTVHPEMKPGQSVMDLIEVPIAELPYRVMTIKSDAGGRAPAGELRSLSAQIAASRLVYGSDFDSSKIARSHGVPYILILEYDLGTRMTVAAKQASNFPQSVVRAVRTGWRYVSEAIPEMRAAHSLHCNGYPIYDATRRHNPRSLLYLDSRMAADMILPAATLAARLAARAGRPLRLLFSGRYERMKGADDAVRVATECLRRGLDIEMHLYGQGSLRGVMQRLAAGAVRADRIVVHESVPYPELVEISRTFDVFVCCHIQSDPSCTYLESFGAGLPIVGYANRMWRRLCGTSNAGFVSPMGNPARVADAVEKLIRDAALLGRLSRNALDFAAKHCFEHEFRKRIDALNAAIQ